MNRISEEHPDLTAAAHTGYATFQSDRNRDTPEHRAAYIEEHTGELVRWLNLGYPEVLEEFLAFSAQVCRESYEAWLN